MSSGAELKSEPIFSVREKAARLGNAAETPPRGTESHDVRSGGKGSSPLPAVLMLSYSLGDRAQPTPRQVLEALPVSAKNHRYSPCPQSQGPLTGGPKHLAPSYAQLLKGFQALVHPTSVDKCSLPGFWGDPRRSLRLRTTNCSSAGSCGDLPRASPFQAAAPFQPQSWDWSPEEAVEFTIHDPAGAERRKGSALAPTRLAGEMAP